MAGEAPRQTRLGPCSGKLSPIQAFDVPLQVDFRFFKDVDEADRAAGFYEPVTGLQDVRTERSLPEEGVEGSASDPTFGCRGTETSAPDQPKDRDASVSAPRRT